MKRIFAVILLMMSFFALVGCDSSDLPSLDFDVNSNEETNNDDANSNESTSTDENTNSDQNTNKEENMGNEENTNTGGNTGSEENTNTGGATNNENKDLASVDVFLVGDSTVCSFNDTSYYYPRYGYGTQMSNYLDDDATIVNLALSGRSSKSFLSESNYTTLSSGIGQGDYLVIGFGHNDEKGDDATRFTDPTLSKEDSSSFKYHLYEKYIKLAINAGATPILCTPVCRADSNDNYSGSSAHITSYGDYAQAIRDLGQETNTTVIDLTLKTKELYTELGYDKAIKYHAWTNSNSKSVDKTHLNIYGAKQVSYMFASELAKTNNSLAQYVLSGISAPTEAADLVVNPSYVEPTYSAPNLSSYNPGNNFATITSGWYGTAFGDTGGNPTNKGFFAKETSAGVFSVGQSGSANAGKITSGPEGIAFAFKQVSVAKNFTITADVAISTDGVSQAGFGLMLRDDVYLNQSSTDSSIVSNYVAAGMYMASSTTHIIYSRESSVLSAGDKTTTGYKTADTAQLKIERIGQVVNCTVIYKGTTYTKTYTDFDFVAIDNDYMYIGMYATRGTVAQFTNVDFEITGDAIAA